MPNIKSAKKRVLVTCKSTKINNDVKQAMKTAIKKVEKAGKEEVESLVLDANKRIDKAASKGVIKANTRDRYKMRLQKIVKSK